MGRGGRQESPRIQDNTFHVSSCVLVFCRLGDDMGEWVRFISGGMVVVMDSGLEMLTRKHDCLIFFRISYLNTTSLFPARLPVDKMC